MVLVELAAEVIETNDVEERYFTIETTPIDENWYEWRNRVIVRPVRGRFYTRQVDLQPGLVTIWVGVTNFGIYDGYTVSWTFRITAKVVSTGQILLDVTDYHPPLQFVNTYDLFVPGTSSGGGGGGGGGGATIDWSEIVKRMMETMLPPMMQMMGMVMMMQMMVGMMQSMVGAVGGVF